jgi:hypothetical protein
MDTVYYSPELPTHFEPSATFMITHLLELKEIL